MGWFDSLQQYAQQPQQPLPVIASQLPAGAPLDQGRSATPEEIAAMNAQVKTFAPGTGALGNGPGVSQGPAPEPYVEPQKFDRPERADDPQYRYTVPGHGPYQIGNNYDRPGSPEYGRPYGAPPEAPPPDITKMTPEQLDALLASQQEAQRNRFQPGGSASRGWR